LRNVVDGSRWRSRPAALRIFLADEVGAGGVADPLQTRLRYTGGYGELVEPLSQPARHGVSGALRLGSRVNSYGPGSPPASGWCRHSVM
jgi:hypothetical protein